MNPEHTDDRPAEAFPPLLMCQSCGAETLRFARGWRGLLSKEPRRHGHRDRGVPQLPKEHTGGVVATSAVVALFGLAPNTGAGDDSPAQDRISPWVPIDRGERKEAVYAASPRPSSYQVTLDGLGNAAAHNAGKSAHRRRSGIESAAANPNFQTHTRQIRLQRDIEFGNVTRPRCSYRGALGNRRCAT